MTPRDYAPGHAAYPAHVVVRRHHDGRYSVAVLVSYDDDGATYYDGEGVEIPRDARHDALPSVPMEWDATAVAHLFDNMGRPVGGAA